MSKSKSFFEAFKFSKSIVFGTSKKYLTIFFTSQLIVALLTPVLIVLAGKLVNIVKEALNSDLFSSEVLIPWLGIAVLASLLGMICRLLSQYSSSRLRNLLSLEIESKVFSHITSLSLSQIENHEIQNIISRAQTLPGKTVFNFLTNFLVIFKELVKVIGLLSVIFWIAPKWALVFTLCFIPFIVLNRKLAELNFTIKRNNTLAKRWSQYYFTVLSGRDFMPLTKTLGLENIFLKRFSEKLDKVYEANRSFYRKRLFTYFTASFLVFPVMALVLYFVSIDIADGRLNIGEFTAFWVAVWKIEGALSSVGKSFFLISDAEFDIFNIQELFSIQNDSCACGNKKIRNSLTSISLENVSFFYNKADSPTIKDVSLDIKSGETVAIVGANGSGKTTLAKLIAQLYAPTSGTIYFDDTPSLDFDRKELQHAISIMPQTPCEFEATVSENIAFGDWKLLSKDKNALVNLTCQIGIDQEIREMPDGYDTLLGRKFGNYDLSGGQWQKIALARAIAGDPKVLILDEPTAAMDIHSEHKLYSQINQLSKKTTTILISHRFSTVKMADRIFVLAEGELVESGSHEELISQNGEYSIMYNQYKKMSLQ